MPRYIRQNLSLETYVVVLVVETSVVVASGVVVSGTYDVVADVVLVLVVDVTSVVVASGVVGGSSVVVDADVLVDVVL